MIYVNMTFYL